MEIGLIFALLTAVFFAMSTIFLRRVLSQTGESFTALVITVFIGTLLFALVITFSGEWDKVWALSWRGLALLGGAGIMHFLVGRFFSLTSVRLIGANKAAALRTTNIFFAVVLAVIFLSESLTIPLVLGILCIAGGATLVSIEKESANIKNQSEFTKIQVKGVLSGLGTGLFWGMSPILIKPGVAEIGSSTAGAFVSFVTASLILASLLLRKGQREQLARLPRSTLIPLAIAGVLSTTAQLFRYYALSYSSVSTATPLMSSQILFVLLFSFFLNRKLEVFTWKVIAAMIAVTAGAVLLSYRF